jgi:membrane associated rhomboid family serine protease
MSVREYKTGKSPLLGQSNNALVMLIAINALVFVLLIFLKIVYFLSYSDAITSEIAFHKQVLEWFTLPAAGSHLITRPWTLFVYMFTNYSIWGLISSLLWLWAFGYILQDLSGNKRIFPVYLYGGIAGAIFFLLSVNFIPSLQRNISITADLMGGGAGVMAIAVATTTLAPDYRLFPLIGGGIPLWVLTLLFVIIDYAGIAGMGGGYAIAHLSGGIVGFFFVRQLRKGQDWGEWMNQVVDWFNDLFNPGKKHRSHLHKQKVFYQSPQTPFQKKVNITQQRLDELLDKIHDEGYHMLTDEEKEFLKQASKEEL